MVSIIIVNYNTAQYTNKCIESILDDPTIGDFEIVLVDNGSTECSPDLFLHKYPSVILVKSPVNLGFAGGNNLGLKFSKGDDLLLLNSDTEVKVGAIFKAVKKMASDPSVGVISAKLLYPEGGIQHVSGCFPTIKKELFELFRLNKFSSKKTSEKIIGGYCFNHESESEVDWVWGSFFLTRRSIIDQLPDARLPAHFFMYYEDVEWCYYIKKKLGYKILYYPEAEVIHHVSKSSNFNDNKWGKANQIITHEFSFIKRYHGDIYGRVLFTLRAINYFSLRKKDFRGMGFKYLKYVFTNQP